MMQNLRKIQVLVVKLNQKLVTDRSGLGRWRGNQLMDGAKGIFHTILTFLLQFTIC